MDLNEPFPKTKRTHNLKPKQLSTKFPTWCLRNAVVKRSLDVCDRLLERISFTMTWNIIKVLIQKWGQLTEVDYKLSHVGNAVISNCCPENVTFPMGVSFHHKSSDV